MDNFPRKLDLALDVDMSFFRSVYDVHGIGNGGWDYDYSDSLSSFARLSTAPECLAFRSLSILCGGFAMQDSFNRSRGIARLDFMRGLPSAGSGEAGACFDFFENWCIGMGVDCIEFHMDTGFGRLVGRDRWMRLRGYKEGFRTYLKALH